MASTGSVAVSTFVGLLTNPTTGIGPALAQIGNDSGVALAPIPPAHVVDQNIPFALAEKGSMVKYPVVHVYSDRIRNLLTEKFRIFSGKVRTVAEVRVSQNRIEEIEQQLRLYVDGVTQVLDANRGSWGQGAFYTGGYEVSFEPVQHGGSNYLQIAKISFEVDFSE